MEVNGQLHVPVALPQGRNSRYTLDRRPGAPCSVVVGYQRFRGFQPWR